MKVMLVLFSLFLSILLTNTALANDDQEKLCIKEMLYFEARNTSLEEMIHIFEVAANRVKSKKYPDSFCEVIQQPWQFSYRNKLRGDPRIILPTFQEITQKSFGYYDRIAWFRIQGLVESRFTVKGEVVENKYLDKSFLHYHTINISPYWSRVGSKKYVKGFKHVFVRL